MNELTEAAEAVNEARRLVNEASKAAMVASVKLALLAESWSESAAMELAEIHVEKELQRKGLL